ncbi:MAG: hypothetical protein WC145_05820 [Aliarcobacter sp.]
MREQYPDVSEDSDRYWRLVQGIYQTMTGRKAVGRSATAQETLAAIVREVARGRARSVPDDGIEKATVRVKAHMRGGKPVRGHTRRGRERAPEEPTTTRRSWPHLLRVATADPHEVPEPDAEAYRLRRALLRDMPQNTHEVHIRCLAEMPIDTKQNILADLASHEGELAEILQWWGATEPGSDEAWSASEELNNVADRLHLWPHLPHEWQHSMPAYVKYSISKDLAKRLADNPDWQQARQLLAIMCNESYRTGDDDVDAAAYLISTWAASSGDNHPWSVAVQIAAAEELGLEDASIRHMGATARKEARAILDEDAYRPAIRAFIRTMYDHTQERLQAAGVTELTLFRGEALPPDKAPTRRAGEGRVTVRSQPLSSWTANPVLAWAVTQWRQSGNRVCSVVYSARVPVARVIATYASGFGCMEEDEVVILGGIDEVSYYQEMS